jgi:hypothetical protein
MEIILNEKTFTTKTIKAKMVRKAVAITENIDFDRLKTTDLDNLVDFVVETFGNQFSREDIYDNLDANLLIPTLIGTIRSIVSGMNQELNQFPKP